MFGNGCHLGSYPKVKMTNPVQFRALQPTRSATGSPAGFISRPKGFESLLRD